MKIYINKYRNHWLSPFIIMGVVLFYKKWTDPEFDLYDDANDKYTDWLVKPCELLRKVLDVVHPKINYVKIDRYDTWSMDHTLAYIILPMLIQLKKDKHGAPFVDDADVPEELKSTAAPAKENEWDTDENHFKRWDWVLDEMIQAFECKVDDKWEDQYRSGEHDFLMVPVDREGNKVARKDAAFFQMADGPKHTYKCDYDAMALHQARNTNGYRLLGKYFEALWD
jgi:hypothetical protein